MDVLRAYAHQVVSNHAMKDRNEMFAEIYDSLCEEFADWQLSNPNGSEVEYLNESKPHPLRYATQLASSGTAYLIGPRFYFSFLQALRVSISIVLVLHILFAVVSVLGSGNLWTAFARLLWSIPEVMLWVSAIVLGVFIALEKTGERADWLDDWDAANLKPADDHSLMSRGEIFFDLTLSSMFLLFLSGVTSVPDVFRHEGQWITDWVIQLPAWSWSLLFALLVFDIGYCLFRLTRDLWSRRLRMVTISSNLIWIGLLGFAAAQPVLLNTEFTQVPELLSLLERIIRGVLVVACLVLVWDTAVHIFRLRKHSDSPGLPSMH